MIGSVVLDYSIREQYIIAAVPTLSLIVLSSLLNLLPLSFASVFESPASKIESKLDSQLEGQFRNRQLALCFISGIQSIAWLIACVISLIENDEHSALFKGLISLGWIYATLSPILSPPTTPPYLLLTIYILHFISALFGLESLILHHSGPINERVIVLTLATITSVTLIAISLTFPISNQAKETDPTIFASPEAHVSLFSWVTFTWVGELLARSKIGKLEYSDIWKLRQEMKGEQVRNSALSFNKVKLIPLIASLNALDMTMSLSLGFLSSFLSYTSPFFLQRILTALTPPAPGQPIDPSLKTSAYVYAFLALIAQVVRAEVDLQQLWSERRAIVRTRSLMMGMVYEKALKRKDGSGVVVTKEMEAKAGKKEEKSKTTAKKPTAAGSTGKIVQLMSSDAMRVANQLMSLSSFVSAPFELIIAIAFLYQLLGWCALAGLSVMAISLPLNNILVKKRIVIHRQVLASRDKRMDVLNEFIQSIRFVKYSASEGAWLERVFSARTGELGWLLKTRMNSLIINVIWNFTPDLISLISFFCFTKILGQELTVPIAFTSLALFALARGPMNSLPSQITSLLETYVSVQRLEAYFDEPEVELWVSGLRPDSEGSRISTSVGIDNGTFRYQTIPKPVASTITPVVSAAPVIPAEVTETTVLIPEVVEEEVKDAFELKVSVNFPIGKLSLVVGSTGSGKTSLFLALLGEMDCLEGTVHLSKETSRIENGYYDGCSYCSQLPWLENATIRENILFGSVVDEARYDAVIDACALRTDLDIFAAGDDTVIGEKGITLSGGQKARISLARAVYSRAKTVLLDDPLAAVDMGTARHLFNKCFQGPLMEGRTIILATHHLALTLPGAEYLVKLSNGQVLHQGPVNTLDRGLLASDLLDEKDYEVQDLEVVDIIAESIAVESNPVTRISTPVSTGVVVEEEVKKPKKADGKLIDEEARAEGRVKFSVYQTYLSSAGYEIWFLIFALILIGRVFRLGDRFWFKIWGESYRQAVVDAIYAQLPTSSLFFQQSTNLFPPAVNQTISAQSWLPDFPSASDNVDFYLLVYFGICVANILVAVIGILVGYVGSFRAAKILFTRTLTTVAYAPFRYWDTTPTGRILNRFSGDFQIIDTSLTDQVRVVLTQTFSFVVNVVVIVFVTPSFILPAMLITFIYVRLSASYIRTSRDLRRLESNSRSPIYSRFGETLAGIVTCRAFSAERRMMTGFFGSVDMMLATHYAGAMVNRYLLWRFDCLGAVAVAVVTFLALSINASPGSAAISITSAQSLISSIYWLCRWISALEVDLNAVERVTELLNTPQEPPQVIEAHRPPALWPSSTTGHISFENLCIAYAEKLPNVIKNVSFEVLPREKIGVVGRTGSGKSTLGMALLRFVEPSQGSITIDGIDITSIGLKDLRSRITLIPQEATLFAGTVRSNLDPMQEHTDEEMLEILERVAMNSKISGSSGTATPISGGEGVDGRKGVTLETLVSAGGLNFSAGQRQLLALARALLKRSNVCILDESTAAVDFETDTIIQRTIREDFADCIVFTIAHRLRTVIDYDKILVLDAGELVEFGSPKELLMVENGVFLKMCQQAADFEELKAAIGL